MRRLRLAGAEVFEVVEPSGEGREFLGEFSEGFFDGVSQRFRSSLGAQVEDELAAGDGFFQ